MIYVDPKWKYRETVDKYILTLKGDYLEILSSFSVWQPKEKADFIIETRAKFYSMNLQRWQIESLWKFMNGYLPYYKLKRSAGRFK